MRTHMSRIAFLGLGSMGSRMAANLLAAGHDVRVWNRTPAAAKRLVEAGATAGQSPRAAARGADFVMSMVTDDDASSSVWTDPETGAIAGLSPHSTVIEMSTVSPHWIASLSQHVTASGARFLDAPVAGTLPQAEGRQLIFFVGGDQEAFEAVKPVLGAMGATIHHIGPTGYGLLFKLAVNGLLAVQIAAIAETLGLLSKSGMDASKAMATLPIASPAGSGMGQLMVQRDFKPRFKVGLMAKDLRYAIETATARRTDLPVVGSARKVFEAARDSGAADDNVTAVAKLYD
jgi:3-hydroxyisobutyrate dehydrogenase